jgi:hypothetical protein
MWVGILCRPVLAVDWNSVDCLCKGLRVLLHPGLREFDRQLLRFRSVDRQRARLNSSGRSTQPVWEVDSTRLGGRLNSSGRSTQLVWEVDSTRLGGRLYSSGRSTLLVWEAVACHHANNDNTPVAGPVPTHRPTRTSSGAPTWLNTLCTMAPPRKKRNTAQSSPGSAAAPGVASPPSTVQDPSGPVEAGAPGPPILLVGSSSVRLPITASIEDKNDQAMSFEQLLDTDGVLLMLPPGAPLKIYETKMKSYSQYVELGSQLPTGQMASIWVNVTGIIENITNRLGEANPTMRLRLDEDTHARVQALGAKIIAALSAPEASSRLRQAHKAPKNLSNRYSHYAKCTFLCVEGDYPPVLWFNRYAAKAMYVYSINPATGGVMHTPNYYAAPKHQLTAANAQQFVGAAVRVLCKVTVKVNAPLGTDPQPKAVARLEFKPQQFVFTGKEVMPAHQTPIESLGLRMDDDAPVEDDSAQPLLHGPDAVAGA